MRFDYGYDAESSGRQPFSFRVLRPLAGHIKAQARLLTLSSVLVLVITAVELAMPYVTKVVVDRFVVPQAGATPDAAPLALVVMGFLMLVIIDLALNYGQRIWMERAGHRIMHRLRIALFDHIQRLPAAFFTRNPVARLVTRLTSDVQNLHELLTSVLAMFFKDLVLLVGIAAVLMAMNPSLAATALAVTPLVAGCAFGLSGRMRQVFRDQRIKVAQINTRLAETVDGIRVIQAFGHQQANRGYFQRLNRQALDLGLEQIHVLALFLPSIELAGVMVTALLVLVGGRQVAGGQVTVGQLVAFLAYMRMFFRPIRDLADKYNILQNALASAERIGRLFDEPVQRPDTGAGVSVARQGGIGSLKVESLVFGYGDDEPVINGLDLEVAAGQTVALVGATGAGKSTLLQLILGFYRPWKGRILVNATPLEQWGVDRLRRYCAWVPQEPILLPVTLRENIFGGQSDRTHRQMERILEAAGCLQMVQRLPEGLETVLTDQGGNLSAGQRQLISIARALARDPQLILLDEATAHVDSETERRIQQAMGRLLAGRTCILVAHRLATARRADRIVVMADGRVVEAGTHEQLIAADGAYARMWRAAEAAGQGR